MPEVKISVDDTINDELITKSKVHTNLTQEVIITTEDKIKICLTNYSDKLGKKNNWIAPLGILLTIIVTLVTADFKSYFFPPDTWRAVFLIGGTICLIWLIKSLINAIASVTIEDVIDELKKRSPVKKEDEGVIYTRGNITFVDKRVSHQEANFKKPDFFIANAIYGADEKNIDVTKKLNELIENESLNITSSNALVPYDPAPGVIKYLTITYAFQGMFHRKRFKENYPVRLP